MAGERKGARQAELFGDGVGTAAALRRPAGKMPAVQNRRRAAGKAASELNAQQRAAVEHGEGPLLVVAGAGTGKTRVITERIRHLLESDPELPGEAIVGLTFTDKAAAEMKYRVTRAVGERGENVFLGTFHAFCTRTADGARSGTETHRRRGLLDLAAAESAAAATGTLPQAGRAGIFSQRLREIFLALPG